MVKTKPMPTAEVIRELLDYVPETGEFTWKPRALRYFPDERACKIWNTRFSGKPALCTVASNGYSYGAIFGENFSSHRVAWLHAKGVVPVEIDHVNGDRLDNRLANLRNVDRSLNCRNLAIRRKNTSGQIGVSWNKAMKAWDVRVGKDRVGFFKVFDEAVAARKAAEAGEYHPNHGRSAALS